jgi:hypothetical protein
MGWKEERSAVDRAAAAAILATLLLASIVSVQSCSDGEDLTIDRNIEGFFLGEKFEDFKDRIGVSVPWTEIPSPPHDPRGMMIAVTGTPSGSTEIEMSRLTFFEDRLAEIVLYYRRTGFTKLETLRHILERRFGTGATSPDGTAEMAYKTYWIKGPGMSITIRRITKMPETELYVQYQHDELMRRMKEKAGR